MRAEGTQSHKGLAVAMQRRISIWFYWSSVFLALGTVLFSGSLYKNRQGMEGLILQAGMDPGHLRRAERLT
jgi:hypothetical protein